MTGQDSERDVLAAEYVLGTLGADEMRMVARQAQDDPALAAAIDEWRHRLLPLGDLVEPVTPEPGAWDHLVRAIRASPDAAARVPLAPRVIPKARSATGGLARAWNSAPLWRVAALALLVGIGGLTLHGRVSPAAIAVAALLGPDGHDALAVADIAPGGQISIRPTRPIEAEEGAVLGLWALPLGAAAPRLLGVLPPQGGSLPGPPLETGSVVMVTVEPAGGPVPGKPPGRTLGQGTVVAVR